MNIHTLIRDASKVHAVLQKVGSTLIATSPCKIIIPEDYMTSELGSYGDEMHIVGDFLIIVDDKYYGVSKACAMVHTKPSRINIITIGVTKYMELHYEIGDNVIVNLNLVQVTTLVYWIYNVFITNGKVPWYMSYTDMCTLFDTALLHGGANLNSDPALLELIAAFMARQKEDKMKFFRHYEHITKAISPYFVALKSVAFGATNTTAKLFGNYLDEGMTSAFVAPSERNEMLEDLLRG